MDEWNKMAEWFPTSIKVLTFPFYWNNVLSDAALMQSLQQLIFPSLYVERLTRLMFPAIFIIYLCLGGSDDTWTESEEFPEDDRVVR